ncbi:MAG: hypothetical protein ACXWP4_27890 [Polyangiales bacterium]
MSRFACALALALAGCGAKTGLPIDGTSGGPTDGVAPGGDSGALGDAGLDVLPPPTGMPKSCSDPRLRMAYLLHEHDELWTFEPPDRFRVLPPLLCDTRALAAKAVSLAVDRTGFAWVLYDSGELFRAPVADPSGCGATSWTPRDGAFHTFQMTFTAEADGSESLYVADANRLARIDTSTFALVPIGPLPAALESPSLAGSAAGQLFAFSRNGAGSTLATIDPRTGALVGRADLPSTAMGSVGAFLFWGGDFYLFTAAVDGNSESSVFHPRDGAVLDLGGLTGRILSASATTCAPG